MFTSCFAFAARCDRQRSLNISCPARWPSHIQELSTRIPLCGLNNVIMVFLSLDIYSVYIQQFLHIYLNVHNVYHDYNARESRSNHCHDTRLGSVYHCDTSELHEHATCTWTQHTLLLIFIQRHNHIQTKSWSYTTHNLLSTSNAQLCG